MITTVDAVFLTLQCAFGIGLFVCCFLRLALTDQDTFADIRAALVCKATAGISVFFAPFAPIFEPEYLHWPAYTTPGVVWLLVLGSSFWMQLATSRHWERCVPRSFIKPEHRTMHRAADFKDSSSC